MLKRLVVEGLGTALLLAVVVGSGIMAERLSPDSRAVALLANALATGAGLYGLITIFGPVSGAHFNPAVTLMAALDREIGLGLAAGYVAVQTAGALMGVWLAHLMFDAPILQISTTARDGLSLGVSEFVATFGLILTIIGTVRARPHAVAACVALYIVAAYWFTASTSFANPAVTVARAWTDTFAGIAPASVPVFVAAQLCGAVGGVFAGRFIFLKPSLT